VNRKQVARKLPLHSPRMISTSTYTEYRTKAGDISLLVRKRKSNDTSGSSDEPPETISVTIGFLPNGHTHERRQRVRFQASYLQMILRCGSTSSPTPTISLSAVLPADSEVFTMAKNGDLKGIIHLCADGKASLSDCDTNGWSLLTVCTSGKRL
jgi:hypothetical protein